MINTNVFSTILHDTQKLHVQLNGWGGLRHHYIARLWESDSTIGLPLRVHGGYGDQRFTLSPH
jgi:hypothetical protein